MWLRGDQRMMWDLVMWTGGAVLGLGALALGGWALWGDRSRGRRRCPRCWYDMSGVQGLRCPECGTSVRREQSLLRARRRWRVVACALVLVIAAAGVAVYPGVQRVDMWRAMPDSLVIWGLAWAPADVWSDTVALDWPQGLDEAQRRRLAQRSTEALRTHRDSHVRWIAMFHLFGLVANGYEEVAVGLMYAARDLNSGIRQETVQGLATVPATWATDVLVNRVVEDPSPWVRGSAAHSLLYHDPAHVSLFLYIVVDAMKDPDASVRQEAASVLAQMGPSAIGIVSELARAATMDPSSSVRWYAVAALEGTGCAGPIAREALERALADEEPDVRERAARALRAIEGR